jgi:HEXXH motif-containing protein
MIRYHTLTPAEFDAIASGNPDAAVIEKLLSAQYSKRIITIRAIMASAADRYPHQYPRLETAYSLLAAAQQDNPAAVRSVLTHPSVGTWAARVLYMLTSAADRSTPLAAELGQLASIAAAAAIRAGRAFTIDVPIRGRTVMLPTLGLATITVTDTATEATVRGDGRQAAATVTVGQHTVTLPADPSQDGPGWQGLRVLRSCHGTASITVDFDDLNSDRDANAAPPTRRQSHEAVAAWQAVLDGAWTLLAGHHPRQACAIGTGLRSISPLEYTEAGGMSITDGASFGGIMLTQPRGPQAFAETLVHEFHHSVLSAVADIARLHTAGPGAVHYSPWRDDPRPIEGLLHGAYAYLGVAGYWEVQRRVLTGGQQAIADFEFARWRRQIVSAAQALADSGTLTEAGTAFVRTMAAAAERWCGLPVAEEPERLARRANADHRVRWRLSNRHPDAAAINATATAWLNGQPCPALLSEIAGTVLPQQCRLSLSERVRLLSLRLSDPAQFRELCANPSRLHQAGATATEADLAYTNDDLVRAADAYQATIQANPCDIESWTGFTLTTAELHGRTSAFFAAPEVARSVYLRIIETADRKPDLNMLEKWAEDPEVTSAKTQMPERPAAETW